MNDIIINDDINYRNKKLLCWLRDSTWKLCHQLHGHSTMIINGWSFCFKVGRSAGDKMLWVRLWVTSFVIITSRTWPGSQSAQHRHSSVIKWFSLFMWQHKKASWNLSEIESFVFSADRFYQVMSRRAPWEFMPCFRGECVITPLFSGLAHLYPDPCFLETMSSQYHVKSSEQGQVSGYWCFH